MLGRLFSSCLFLGLACSAFFTDLIKRNLSLRTKGWWLITLNGASGFLTGSRCTVTQRGFTRIVYILLYAVAFNHHLRVTKIIGCIVMHTLCTAPLCISDRFFTHLGKYFWLTFCRHMLFVVFCRQFTWLTHELGSWCSTCRDTFISFLIVYLAVYIVDFVFSALALTTVRRVILGFAHLLWVSTRVVRDGFEWTHSVRSRRVALLVPPCGRTGRAGFDFITHSEELLVVPIALSLYLVQFFIDLLVLDYNWVPVEGVHILVGK
jgi:hypothetical protein